MPNLNKENFWDNIEKQYPVAFKNFSGWIDRYKKEVHWNQLFGNGLTQPLIDEFNNKVGTERKDIKFHDIPYEMQIGIILRFAYENKYWLVLMSYYNPNVNDFQQTANESITAMFQFLNNYDGKNSIT